MPSPTSIQIEAIAAIAQRLYAQGMSSNDIAVYLDSNAKTSWAGIDAILDAIQIGKRNYEITQYQLGQIGKGEASEALAEVANRGIYVAYRVRFEAWIENKTGGMRRGTPPFVSTVVEVPYDYIADEIITAAQHILANAYASEQQGPESGTVLLNGTIEASFEGGRADANKVGN